MSDSVRYRFECTECGDCCRREGLVFFTPEDISRVAERLNWDAAELRRRYLTDSPDGECIEVPEGHACPFLLDDACTIHAVRPEQCRTYPFWPELRDPQRWKEEARDCPGIGRGAAHDESEFDAS